MEELLKFWKKEIKSIAEGAQKLETLESKKLGASELDDYYASYYAEHFRETVARLRHLATSLESFAHIESCLYAQKKDQKSL